MRTLCVRALVYAALALSVPAIYSQEEQPQPKAQPAYDDTFAGPIVELSATKVTVSRNILGKTEKRTFLIKSDTKIEGQLKTKLKVTVGFVTSDEGDIARLIVTHPSGHDK